MSNLREGINKIIWATDTDPEPDEKVWEGNLVDNILSYLKSQNVVRLKDNQGLPQTYTGSNESWQAGYEHGQTLMRRANFKAVEELE